MKPDTNEHLECTNTHTHTAYATPTSVCAKRQHAPVREKRKRGGVTNHGTRQKSNTDERTKKEKERIHTYRQTNSTHSRKTQTKTLSTVRHTHNMPQVRLAGSQSILGQHVIISLNARSGEACIRIFPFAHALPARRAGVKHSTRKQEQQNISARQCQDARARTIACTQWIQHQAHPSGAHTNKTPPDSATYRARAMAPLSAAIMSSRVGGLARNVAALSLRTNKNCSTMKRMVLSGRGEEKK